ncbi:ATP-binding protein [Planococcus maritimus]|uniref:ATP-binding protein n=1 Tax=Planococcus maritimus TaxID=192421 RepID=UPI000796BD04|nr:ATP-binding protein [Planococcus maritimus]KYG59885.1 histidine kinase [Planococcus maritimus]
MVKTQANNSYVPPSLAIQAMRDNGYKNTAYAIAELIDNSIQAGAKNVELLCAEQEVNIGSRRVKNVSQIAILDNGEGMDEDILQMALQFGNGTRLSKEKRTGMGRFGMGLPASSISQCKRVDIWSWQGGEENAKHIYLDVDEVKAGKDGAMPIPKSDVIPAMWKKVSKGLGDSGTLVVWSDLDKLMWRKGKTVIENSELLIGRMYRKFLENEELTIRMLSFDRNDLDHFNLEGIAKPNDPMYLMEKTSCPEPYDEIPMFEKLCDDIVFTVEFNGQKHDITTRFSYAKAEARKAYNAGGLPHGKHAQKNVGISIVRAGRELELDQTLVIQHDPRERWWGVEIEFPPSLDEVMGVSNNKQSASNFSGVLQFIKDINEFTSKSEKTYHALKEEMQNDGDPREPLLDIANRIQLQLSSMRKLIEAQNKGQNNTAKKRHEDVENSPEKKATDLTAERTKDGHVGESDKDSGLSVDEKKEAIKEDLVNTGVEETQAEALAIRTVSNNLKYTFANTTFESDAFFSVRAKGGGINIVLNTGHDAYTHLVEVLETDYENQSEADLKERLIEASNGLKLLLMAWARYEDELPAPQKGRAEDARKDWGRIAKKFLHSIDE